MTRNVLGLVTKLEREGKHFITIFLKIIFQTSFHKYVDNNDFVI